ncbi:MAG: HAD family phosphatase [Thalassovita sp.]
MPALLFDLDGTMLNSDALHEAIFKDILEERGVVLGDNWYQQKIHGRLNADIFADLLPELRDPEALSVEKEAEFRRRLPVPYPSLPGLAALLEDCATWPKAVVTNAPRLNAEAMLRAIGVREAFDVLVIGDECAKGKPDPEPYLEAMRQLGVRAEDCVAFEDSPSGLRAARDSGAYSVGVRSTLDDAALRRAGAQCSIQDFEDTALADVLTSLKE